MAVQMAHIVCAKWNFTPYIRDATHPTIAAADVPQANTHTHTDKFSKGRNEHRYPMTYSTQLDHPLSTHNSPAGVANNLNLD